MVEVKCTQDKEYENFTIQGSCNSIEFMKYIKK